MIDRVYFVSGIIKRDGEIKLHFHSNIHLRSWLPKSIPVEKIVESAKKHLPVEEGDDLILTACNRI